MNGDYTSDGPYVLSFSEMERRNADLKNILFQTIETNKNIVEGSKAQKMMNAIDMVVSKENPANQEVLRNLMIMTSFMENSMGADSSAFGRNYTNSFMSIDDPTFNTMMDPREYDYTPTQKKYQKRYEELGLPSDKAGLLNLLESDNPLAAMAVARQVYGMSTKDLPANNPRALFDYYMQVYNGFGANEYGDNEKHYNRFLTGYNKYIK